MKRLLTLIVLTVLFCLGMSAQNPTYTVVSFDGQFLYYNDNSGKLKSIPVTPVQVLAAPTGTCTGTQTAINTTTGNLYYCNSSSPTGTGTWASSGSSRGSGAQAIYVADYNPQPYQIAFDATWSTNGTAVTISANDQPFTAALNNQPCFGMPGVAQGPSTAGTFTFVTATSGICGPAGSLVGSAASNGSFQVGPDSTNAFLNATAALYALPNCGTLWLPSGHYFWNTGVGSANVTNTNCANSSPPGSPAAGASIRGQGYLATIITPLPGFTFTASGAKGCSSLGCFWNSSNIFATYLDFTVDGLGQNLNGVSTAPASSLFTLGPNSLGINVDFFNWGSSASNGPQGCQITGTGAYGLGLSCQNFGANNADIYCNSNQGLLQNSAGNPTLQIVGGANCYDLYGNYIGLFNNGGNFYGTGTRTAAQASGSTASVASGGLDVLDQVSIGQGSNGSGTAGISITGTVDAASTTFNGGSTGGCITGTGTLINRGNNKCTGGPLLFTGTYIDLTGVFPGAGCSGTATSSSTLGLYGTGPNLTTTTCTSTTIGGGIRMSKSGTIYALIVTATHAGVNASSGVVTVLKNGGAQSMTCTIGTGTSCTDGTTAHQVSYIAGDLISLQFTTQTAEVLAGVQTSLVVW